MDNKRLIVVMLIGALVILAWKPLTDRIGQRMGYDMTTKLPDPAAESSGSAANPSGTPATMAGNAGAMTTMPTTANGTPTTGAAAIAGGWSVVSPSAGPTTQLAGGIEVSTEIPLGSIEKEDPNYAMQLVVSPHGAGLERVALNDYQHQLRSPDRFHFEEPHPAFPEQTRPLAIRGVTIDGVDVDLTNALWTPVLNPPAADWQSVTYTLTLAHAGKPAIELRRTWTLLKRDAGKWDANGKTYAPEGYEPRVDTTARNLGDAPVTLTIRFNAPSVPPTESERYSDTQYIIGYAADGVVAPDSPISSTTIKDPADLLKDRKARQPYWFGTTTTYFMALFRFDPQGGTNVPLDWFGAVNAHTLTPDKSGTDRADEVVIVTKPLVVQPHADGTIAAHIYLGPKKREVLANAYYSAPWIQYNRGLVITNWFCGFCTWQWLIDVLFLVLKAFHAVTRDWGLSIICLVFLVRALLHPITKRAQMNMLKFGKLTPEMAKIKERYKDDKDEQSRHMMAFYREHGGTQLAGCLPMFLQMPIWIALWQAMYTTFELRQQPFLYGLTWIHDLSKPDHLIDFSAHGWHNIQLPLLSFVVISGLNVLPFVYGFLQYLQFKIQPKPPTMTPEQEQQQQAMQRMMLFMMPVVLYASPAGLMIYMITSYLLGILESKLVKKQFAKMEENAARFQIIEDDQPRPANVQKATVRRKEDQPKKKGLMGMLAEARDRASDMQREMEKQRKKRS